MHLTSTWCCRLLLHRLHSVLHYLHRFGVLSVPREVPVCSYLWPTQISMAPKEAFKPKPSAKSEKNKPKGGKAKDEKRAALKEKKAGKEGGLASLGGKK